jgi:hypothetical protein
MMKQDLEYFIAERAEHLAVVYFTRSQNLGIERLKSDYGLDMLVTIFRDKVPTGRVFGVRVKGRDKALIDCHDTFSPLSQQENDYLRDLPFPVCILFFTMEDDKGYFRWMKYSSDSNRHLRFAEANAWLSLEECPAEQMIEEVNTWYNEKSHSAA